MADQINLSFPDGSYSSSNPPSVVTLKGDLTLIQDEYNQAATEINSVTARVTTAEADIVDVRGQQEGLLINGKIVTSVSSNNLTVAIKTLAGADPTSDDPVYVRIGNVIRSITAALSVTKNAGTNWFNKGDGFETDFFLYVIWNTTPATDRVDIGISRTPYGLTYSDFSGTTTNEKYLAFSNSDTPTSTDSCRVAARFNATLGAAASYNWSIPATSTIVQYPIFETRWLQWQPTTASFTVGSGSAYYYYQIAGGKVHMSFSLTSGIGYSWQNASSWTVPMPATLSSPIFPVRCLTATIGENWNANYALIEGGSIKIVNAAGSLLFATNPVSGTGGDWRFGGHESQVVFLGWYPMA